MVLILFGVTGAGKTVIGQRLAHEVGWSFHAWPPDAIVREIRTRMSLERLATTRRRV